MRYETSNNLSDSYITKDGDVELNSNYETVYQSPEKRMIVVPNESMNIKFRESRTHEKNNLRETIDQVLRNSEYLKRLLISSTLAKTLDSISVSSITTRQDDTDQLQSIKQEIKDSEYIPALEEDWDQDGALVIKQEIWQAATDFLLRYAQFILDNYQGIVIDTPEINPVRNGSVDLSWRTPKARMLINIREEKDTIQAYYYGDLYNNINSIKGNVSLRDVAEHLAVWMKHLEK